ncbi:MAG: sugar-binding protein [Verrucomicrobiota bacterium]
MKKTCIIAGIVLLINSYCGFSVHGAQEPNKEIKNGKMPEALPLITVSRAGKPVIDGKLDDACWQNSVGISSLPNRTGDKFTEDTFFYITYDTENLYIGAEVQQSYLDPVYNLLDKIKPAADKRDGPVYCDDSIEIFLMPGDFYYQIVVNLDGTVYDAKGTSPEWNSSLKAVTAKKEKSWTVEIAIPFADLGVKNPEGQQWRANFYRNNPAKKESGAWSPAEKSFHTIAAFGRVNFADRAPIIRGKNISLKSGSAEVGLSAITREALKISGSTDELSIAPGTNQNIVVRVKPDSDGNGQLAVLAGKTEIFRTPLLSIKSKTSEMLAEIACPGNTIDIFINGKLISSGRDSVRTSLFLEDAKNTVALKIAGETNSIPTGQFTVAGISFALDKWLCSGKQENNWNSASFDDSKWDLYQGGGVQAGLFFRHTLIKNHTLFAPQLVKNTLYIANKALMCIAIRIGSPFEKPLADYACHLSLPDGLNIPLYDPENRSWYIYKHTIARNKKDGMTEYAFNFEKPVPKLKYNFGAHVIVLVISPEFPKNQEKKTLKGACYISGRGMHEIPGEFNIAVLPALKGIQPANIGIGTWAEGRRISPAETESMFKTFASMGLNRLGIYFRAGSSSTTGASAYTNINNTVKTLKGKNLKPVLCHYGNHDTSFFADILAQHPETQLVNNVNERPAWQKFICPEVFMSAPEIQKRLEDLAMLHDLIIYDLEAGIKSSCLCEKCRSNIARECKLDAIPSEKDVYEKYKDALIRHQVKVNYRIYNFIRDTAKKANPALKCGVYSGYAENRPEVYGMDWTLYRDIVDVPSAGYSESPAIIRATRKLIGNHPLYTGLILNSNLYEYQYADQDIKARLFSQLIQGGFGGVHFYSWEELNGIGMTAVAEFARGVAAFEHILKEQHEIPNDGFVTGTAGENIHVYKKGDEYLYVVLNPSPKAKEITVKAPPGIPDAEIYDFYAARKYEPSAEYKIQAPSYDAALVHISKPGILNALFHPEKTK